MEILAYISKNGERFLFSDNYRNIAELSHGHVPLPANGYPYRLEMHHSPSPKLRVSDESWDVVHNIICLIVHEHQDMIEWLKTSAKNNNSYEAAFLLSTINFVTNDMAAYCNANGITNLFDHPLSHEHIIDIITLMSIRKECGIGADVVTSVLDKLIKNGDLSFADALESSLPIVMDDDELKNIVRDAILEMPDKLAEWKGGKKGIASMFVGVVMRKKKGLEVKKVVSLIDETLNSL